MENFSNQHSQAQSLHRAVVVVSAVRDPVLLGCGAETLGGDGTCRGRWQFGVAPEKHLPQRICSELIFLRMGLSSC